MAKFRPGFGWVQRNRMPGLAKNSCGTATTSLQAHQVSAQALAAAAQVRKVAHWRISPQLC